MTSKVVAVFGATGAQGGSVLRALLSGGYHVRALTRNVNSDKAKALSQLENVSVVEANLDDQESLDRALKGSHGAFLVTDFSAHLENKEIDQGKRAINSAIKNGLSQFVFSGLDNAKSVTGRDVFHFDFKYEIEQYCFQNGNKINFTSVRLPFYFENFPNLMFHKIGDQQYAVTLPMSNKLMYGASVDDLGKVF
jgi:uncharacterized protein YbjT (DUF2867 family)